MKQIEAPPNAETSIELVERGEAGIARYRLRPLTGKKHQLRVHMAALKIPILNDRLYPVYKRDADDFSRPLQLVARSIAFRDPVSGRELFFQSAYELDLRV
jgi:tRNA pseudouridine32 synthase/23S rRNA pseudouridine746 synthase